ncbi:hypothetical protein OsI_15322 [Oryza sativa Indica Group]|uniref:Uncharacterized protein n=1 Tax=Oryza sativa subsp. indica TaxID=39946 RepID=A2XRR8_ORYSI|nr:hypothetical protein OsI_15322 [Oryza sativa Indica Group]
MGREAAAEAEEQLLRRSLRLFAAGERSFRMDRLSPDADALRAAVADVLPRFLGSYTDDILACSVGWRDDRKQNGVLVELEMGLIGKRRYPNFT